MSASGDRKFAAASAAETLAQGLPPLAVRAEQLASSISLGLHGRHKAGIGLDFWQYHRYRQEDDFGAIDWRQSARSQHLFVREHEGEAAQSVFFWRDGAPGMRYASGVCESKIDRAGLISLALSLLLVRAGERVALYGEKARPGASRLAYWRMVHGLWTQPPSDGGLPPEAPLPPYSQFVWVSDFLSPVEKIEAAMRRLIEKGARGRLVHIVDPAEEDFPFAGRVRFEAADGGDEHLFGRAEAVAAAYRRRFRARSVALGDLARHLGWNYLVHRTDRSPRTALIALYADLSGEPGGSGQS